MYHENTRVLLTALLVAGCGAEGPSIVAGSVESQPLREARTGDPSTRHRVLVLFDGPLDELARSRVHALGGDVHRVFHLLPAMSAEIPEAAIDDLALTPRVLAIDLDGEVRALDAELDSSWGVAHIGADVAHAAGIRGAGARIAIVDSGIDATHPDLDGSFAGGWDFVDQDADPGDAHGHGTMVAGIIGAEDNAVGVVGVAPLAQLYALRVLDASGAGSWSRVIAALEWAVDAGIVVANHSYGSITNPGATVEQAFANAQAAGLLNIAAAGNSGTCTGRGDTIIYPAAYPSVLAVGAVDARDVRPCFSSTGAALDLVAPGVSITSTTLTTLGSYAQNQGTSFAAPHVTGAAALALGAGVADSNGDGRIDDELRIRLLTTAQDLGPTGWDSGYGNGLIDAAAVVAGVGGTPPPPPPPPALSLTASEVRYANAGRSLWVIIAVVDEAGAPVALARVAAGIYRSGKLLASRDGLTDDSGAVHFELRNVKPGCFETVVTAVSKSGYEWDGATPPNAFCR